MSLQQNASLEHLDNELFSLVRRNINSLKQKESSARKSAINELIKVVTEKTVSATVFEQIMHMGLKDIIKCYYDHLESIRENSIKLTTQLLSRCRNIRPFLPYIFQALKDRTNCLDLQGIDKLPEKMRPQPGQKPKVMLKLIENCEEIRIMYCGLIKRIVLLLEQDKHEMARHLDDMVNIIRSLIMDPAPDVQKQACQLLIIFCNQYKDILLHFTQTMGRAVLLPLISKKSKIRISGLNALTAIFWCGLWKYNAFVFQNLIGFRDPNSVPIKDFYQPTNNINYLATFIIDPNVKVRQQFMRHLKIWICDLNDKYDHHGKLVPYLLSGLSDTDQLVRQTAMSAIVNIGKQLQEEKQKQFRENKQFAIDAVWTWEGKLVNLPVDQPLKTRPSLGSRYFIRGHVRKFWGALYKQLRDLNEENRIRSANLALFGVIFTQNYLTQFLDNFIPQLLPSILPTNQNQRRVSLKVCKIFEYIGRYCEQSAYIHLIKSALEGKLIQNEQFVKCAMKGLAMLIKGNLDAIPTNQNLCHKKANIIQLLTLLQQCQIAGDVYNFNCIQAREIAESIIKGITEKASPQQRQQILSLHYLTLVKLISVSYFEELYSNGFSLKSSKQVEQSHNKIFENFVQNLNALHALYPSGIEQVKDFLSNVFCNPPSLMDSDWKLLVIFYRYLCIKGTSDQQLFNLFLLVQDTISECLSQNKSIELLAFTIKFLYNLISTVQKDYPNSSLNRSNKLLVECLKNLYHFKPIKKVPVYDQHLVKQEQNPEVLKTNEQNYNNLFIFSSRCLSGYCLNKITLLLSHLAQLIEHYFKNFQKVFRNKECLECAIKTIWAIFEKAQMNQKFAQSLKFQETKDNFKYIVPEVIDFCVGRLEEYLDSKQNNFIFKILENISISWPKILKITDKIPQIYSDFPVLLQKLFKYCLNERDSETKQRYMEFLQKIAKKMPEWFKYEASLAQKQKRFEKAKLIEEIVKNSNI